MAIKAVYVVKDTGFSLFHRTYNNGSCPDEDLVGGFISAIFNFFKEYCGDQITKMETKLVKFFYYIYNKIIFVIVTEIDNKDEVSIRELLRTLAENFVYKFGARINEDIDRSKFSEFEKIVDQFVEEYNEANNGNQTAKVNLEEMDKFVKDAIKKRLIYDSLNNKQERIPSIQEKVF
ncbi:MAG: hypothetical protein QXO71_01870 [Candidatus Jordarchaeaceae archaeon]